MRKDGARCSRVAALYYSCGQDAITAILTRDIACHPLCHAAVMRIAHGLVSQTAAALYPVYAALNPAVERDHADSRGAAVQFGGTQNTVCPSSSCHVLYLVVAVGLG
jgi:hypothetical protein